MSLEISQRSTTNPHSIAINNPTKLGATGALTVAVEVPEGPLVPFGIGRGGGGTFGLEGGEARVIEADTILNQKFCDSLWLNPKVEALAMSCQLTGNQPIYGHEILISTKHSTTGPQWCNQANKKNEQTRRQ